jgi:serine/threonine protein kinase
MGQGRGRGGTSRLSPRRGGLAARTLAATIPQRSLPSSPPPPTACQVVVPVLTSLAHMHAAGIIHRDIKLENLFVSPARGIMLGDFGLALCVHEEKPISPVGTLGALPERRAALSMVLAILPPLPPPINCLDCPDCPCAGPTYSHHRFIRPHPCRHPTPPNAPPPQPTRIHAA